MVAYPKSVIIVEDEAETGDMFAEMMRLNGFQVHRSSGGRLAMSMIAHKKPNAVLLDVMMPDISGLEVLRFMKRDPNLSGIPVIIVSARSQFSDIQEGLEAGAKVYLTKPVAYPELISAVKNALDNIDPGPEGVPI
jgi:two-component system phosphate regulon response regulator PhoB